MATKSTFPAGSCKPIVAPKVEYYDVGGLRTLDVIKSKLTPEQYEGFLLGNTIKYALRLNWKGDSMKDAKKLADYATWLAAVKGTIIEETT